MLVHPSTTPNIVLVLSLCSDDLQQACQIPLISVIQPLLPIEPAGEDDGSSGAAPLDAPDISRCHGCLGYINHLCAFERQGWVCSLCGVLNDYAIAANRRYLGGDEARRQLPELCPGPVEAVAPVQEGDQDEASYYQ